MNLDMAGDMQSYNIVRLSPFGEKATLERFTQNTLIHIMDIARREGGEVLSPMRDSFHKRWVVKDNHGNTFFAE